MKRLSFFMPIIAGMLYIFMMPIKAASPDISDGMARSCILVEQTTGKVLFEKNGDAKYNPASMTKIMTMLLVAEGIDSGAFAPTDMVTVSAYASGMGGSQIYLAPGEQMTVGDLLKAVAVASANDAAAALAEFVGGSESDFVELMNKKAQSLGMKDTHFENSFGLDAELHLTSARDVAVMSRELLRHSWISKYSTIWMDTLRNGATSLANTNKLVHSYNGITGLKTGFTNKARYCVSASAERSGLKLVAVVMGGETSPLRFEGASALLDYGFSKYTMVNPVKLASESGEFPAIRVKNGMEELVMPVTEQLVGDAGEGGVLLGKDEARGVTCRVELPESIDAPVKKGQIIGAIALDAGEKEIARLPLKADRDVRKLGFLDIFMHVILRFFNA